MRGLPLSFVLLYLMAFNPVNLLGQKTLYTINYQIGFSDLQLQNRVVSSFTYSGPSLVNSIGFGAEKKNSQRLSATFSKTILRSNLLNGFEYVNIPNNDQYINQSELKARYLEVKYEYLFHLLSRDTDWNLIAGAQLSYIYFDNHFLTYSFTNIQKNSLLSIKPAVRVAYKHNNWKGTFAVASPLYALTYSWIKYNNNLKDNYNGNGVLNTYRGFDTQASVSYKLLKDISVELVGLQQFSTVRTFKESRLLFYGVLFGIHYQINRNEK